MPMKKRPKENQYKRCAKVFTSLMRLCHHLAAEHSIKTSRDIRSGHHIPHRPKKVTLIRV